MNKFILISLLIHSIITNSYCELLELNSTNFPNIKEKRIVEVSMDTIKYVRENQKVLAQYSQSTEYFIASEFPKITIITRLSDKADGSITVYFDERVNFKINSKLFHLYLRDGKIYVDEESLMLRDFDNLEPQVHNMLLKYRQQLYHTKEKFDTEEKNIFIILNNSNYKK